MAPDPRPLGHPDGRRGGGFVVTELPPVATGQARCGYSADPDEDRCGEPQPRRLHGKVPYAVNRKQGTRLLLIEVEDFGDDCDDAIANFIELANDAGQILVSHPTRPENRPDFLVYALPIASIEIEPLPDELPLTNGRPDYIRDYVLGEGGAS